jgi:hypothetical protein
MGDERFLYSIPGAASSVAAMSAEDAETWYFIAPSRYGTVAGNRGKVPLATGRAPCATCRTRAYRRSGSDLLHIVAKRKNL